MKKILVCSLFLAILCLPSLAEDFLPGQIVVKFNSDTISIPEGIRSQSAERTSIKAHSILSLNNKYGVTEIEKVFPDAQKPESIVRVMKSGDTIEVPDFTRFYIFRVPEDTDILAAVKEYENNVSVDFAQPNYIVRAFVVPNDPSYASQWWLPKINAPSAWDISTGTTEIIVADVDTGVDYFNEDLDAAGKVVLGEDFENGDNNPLDDNGHGTHIAGIIGAETNNAVGVAGLGWNVRVMAVKVLDSAGNGSSTSVSNGIRYAADNGAQVINMSFGSFINDTLIRNAVVYAYGLGCVLCAAAGNEDVSSRTYPAALDQVIAVAATDSSDVRSVWGALASNFGTWVDVCAPGTNIYSTELVSNGSYMSKNGTSMATPIVCALAGLLLSRNPTWTEAEVRARIKDTCDDIDALNPGYAGLLGSGRVNAQRAMGVPQVSISSPASGAIISGTQTVTGTADMGTGLAYYKVYVGTSEVISGTTSKTNDTLGSFDTTSFTDGLYTMKLEAVSTEPFTSEVTVQVTIDNTPPTAQVTSPVSGESVAGTITIRGTASDANPDYYQLEYTDTTGVIVISSSSGAVSDGILGQWNTSGLEGNYNLRLLVIDQAGLSSSDTVNINITSGAAPDLELEGLVKSTPNPYSPSRDGTAYFHYTLSDNSAIEIFIFSLSGELIWRTTYPAGSEGGKAGENLAPWNGQTSYGESVQNGVYFYKLVSAAAGKRVIGSGRIIVLK